MEIQFYLSGLENTDTKIISSNFITQNNKFPPIYTSILQYKGYVLSCGTNLGLVRMYLINLLNISIKVIFSLYLHQEVSKPYLSHVSL